MKINALLASAAITALLLSGCSTENTSVVEETTVTQATESVVTEATREQPKTSEIESTEKTVTTAERVYEELPDADIRNLKWGMTLEDVKLYEKEKVSKEEFFKAGYDDSGNYHGNYTMLTYDDVTISEIENIKLQMYICVYEDEGLTNVSYYAEGEDCQYILDVLFNESQKKYGGFDTDSSFCYFNADNSISSCWWDWATIRWLVLPLLVRLLLKRL